MVLDSLDPFVRLAPRFFAGNDRPKMLYIGRYHRLDEGDFLFTNWRGCNPFQPIASVHRFAFNFVCKLFETVLDAARVGPLVIFEYLSVVVVPR